MENNRSYPLNMHREVYQAFKQIAAMKGLTMKDAIKSALGLYIADNINIITINPKESANDKDEQTAGTSTNNQLSDKE